MSNRSAKFPKKGESGKLDEREREQVILAWRSGKSISEIACKRRLTRSYVQDAIREYNQEEAK